MRLIETVHSEYIDELMPMLQSIFEVRFIVGNEDKVLRAIYVPNKTEDTIYYEIIGFVRGYLTAVKTYDCNDIVEDHKRMWELEKE